MDVMWYLHVESCVGGLGGGVRGGPVAHDPALEAHALLQVYTQALPQIDINTKSSVILMFSIS
jgi:hypothetical protein